jgi:hypothetical protein
MGMAMYNYTEKPTAWYMFRLKRMDQMIENGATYEEVGEAFNLTARVVRVILREAWKRGFLEEVP